MGADRLSVAHETPCRKRGVFVFMRSLYRTMQRSSSLFLFSPFFRRRFSGGFFAPPTFFYFFAPKKLDKKKKMV